MDAKDLLRGGEPVVCIATRIAYHQEAEYLARIRAARRPRSAAPRISIEIAPATAAALEAAAGQQTAAARDTEKHDG